MRIANTGHAVFAAALIVFGIQGLVTGNFSAVWQPIPANLPARAALADACAVISLACGIGLFWRRTAGLASRVLLSALVLWFLVWRVRPLFVAPLIEATWSCGAALVMIAAAWSLWAGQRLRVACVLLGLGLIPFGYAHFANLKGTADLVPAWLPGHAAWAYFTGGAFIAAAAALLIGVRARLAAALAAVEMGMFGLLVWVPVVAAGSAKPYQWTEFATTIALTAAAWAVADSRPRRDAAPISS